MRTAPLVALLLLAIAGAAGCSSADSAAIQLVTDTQADPFAESPAPVELVVQSIDTSNDRTTLATAPFPTTSIDLGKQSESTAATLAVSGLDASGNALIFGESLLLDFGALVSQTVPIFVQRVGESARLPGTLDARTSPVLSPVQAEYVFVTGGNEPSLAGTSQLYDFAQLTPLGAPPAMPVVPLSVAVVGTVAMLLDGTANTGATYFDLSQNASAQVPALGGPYTFADVAGGQTVVAKDGTTFVVGATRTVGAPTAAVLKIDPSDTTNASYVSGNLTWLSLTAPRYGAAAVWVDGRGLVVAGGSATAPGVEVLGESGATAATVLPYPPDATVGAGAATTDDANTVVLAGGFLPSGADPGVRALSLACTTCSATAWTTLPTPIGTAAAFDLDPTHVLVVGNELGDGTTHVFLASGPGSARGASATEIPTKIAHKNAGAIVSPVGSVVLLGGDAQMESIALAVPPGS